MFSIVFSPFSLDERTGGKILNYKPTQESWLKVQASEGGNTCVFWVHILKGFEMRGSNKRKETSDNFVGELSVQLMKVVLLELCYFIVNVFYIWTYHSLESWHAHVANVIKNFYSQKLCHVTIKEVLHLCSLCTWLCMLKNFIRIFRSQGYLVLFLIYVFPNYNPKVLIPVFDDHLMISYSALTLYKNVPFLKVTVPKSYFCFEGLHLCICLFVFTYWLQFLLPPSPPSTPPPLPLKSSPPSLLLFFRKGWSSQGYQFQ